MTINYLILAHTNPPQVKRLVAALNQKNTRFYVHVDLKTNLSPFKEALSEFPNLYLLPEDQRETCNWGGIGIVKATLTMLRLVEESGEKGYVVLLSGQDYPVKSKDYIGTYFQNNAGSDFISWFSLPTSRWTRGGMDRINRYKIDLSDKKGDFVQLPSIHSREFYSFGCLKKLVKVISRKKVSKLSVLLYKKKFPPYLKPYGGDTWWALRTETTSKILRLIRTHADLMKFMNFSNLPDEMLFQSLVLEINKENLDSIKNSLTYANWSGKDETSPRTFTPEDLLRLKALPPDFLFARKFDLNLYPQLLDSIEQELLPDQSKKKRSQ
ncbi:beta-1,6-N-acetylglucosaminyltransferase [Cyclobacterium jeungdonense]|uniref:Peptide O-xylosyltransferase n=1 Tax=Cyclobacterium jeungdonense TaxID=708087 RepID=A0ABT8C4M3_9BACT|nr:beta-1,6-N-acetylglucosaminyltransferase [Cyclobacterium jeungdonense]MDN3686563.1 beta-1,6-N-acetylglucosaminyltransferase [Cyclobacterium jeungdonense]